MDSQSVLYHFFAGDTQMQKSAPPQHVDELIQSMQQCVYDVKSWMTQQTETKRWQDGSTDHIFTKDFKLYTSYSLNCWKPDSPLLSVSQISWSNA